MVIDVLELYESAERARPELSLKQPRYCHAPTMLPGVGVPAQGRVVVEDVVREDVVVEALTETWELEINERAEVLEDEREVNRLVDDVGETLEDGVREDDAKRLST